VIATSLNHQIISPYTSFIAVEKPPETSSLFAKNNLSSDQKLDMKKLLARKAKSNVIQAHESLLVALPQTSLGWHSQFMIGFVLLLLGLVFVRVSDVTFLISNSFIKASRHEEDN